MTDFPPLSRSFFIHLLAALVIQFALSGCGDQALNAQNEKPKADPKSEVPIPAGGRPGSTPEKPKASGNHDVFHFKTMYFDLSSNEIKRFDFALGEGFDSADTTNPRRASALEFDKSAVQVIGNATSSMDLLYSSSNTNRSTMSGLNVGASFAAEGGVANVKASAAYGQAIFSNQIEKSEELDLYVWQEFARASLPVTGENVPRIATEAEDLKRHGSGFVSEVFYGFARRIRLRIHFAGDATSEQRAAVAKLIGSYSTYSAAAALNLKNELQNLKTQFRIEAKVLAIGPMNPATFLGADAYKLGAVSMSEWNATAAAPPEKAASGAAKLSPVAEPEPPGPVVATGRTTAMSGSESMQHFMTSIAHDLSEASALARKGAVDGNPDMAGVVVRVGITPYSVLPFKNPPKETPVPSAAGAWAKLLSKETLLTAMLDEYQDNQRLIDLATYLLEESPAYGKLRAEVGGNVDELNKEREALAHLRKIATTRQTDLLGQAKKVLEDTTGQLDKDREDYNNKANRFQTNEDTAKSIHDRLLADDYKHAKGEIDKSILSFENGSIKRPVRDALTLPMPFIAFVLDNVTIKKAELFKNGEWAPRETDGLDFGIPDVPNLNLGTPPTRPENEFFVFNPTKGEKGESSNFRAVPQIVTTVTVTYMVTGLGQSKEIAFELNNNLRPKRDPSENSSDRMIPRPASALISGVRPFDQIVLSPKTFQSKFVRWSIERNRSPHTHTNDGVSRPAIANTIEGVDTPTYTGYPVNSPDESIANGEVAVSADRPMLLSVESILINRNNPVQIRFRFRTTSQNQKSAIEYEASGRFIVSWRRSELGLRK